MEASTRETSAKIIAEFERAMASNMEDLLRYTDKLDDLVNAVRDIAYRVPSAAPYKMQIIQLRNAIEEKIDELKKLVDQLYDVLENVYNKAPTAELVDKLTAEQVKRLADEFEYAMFYSMWRAYTYVEDIEDYVIHSAKEMYYIVDSIPDFMPIKKKFKGLYDAIFEKVDKLWDKLHEIELLTGQLNNEMVDAYIEAHDCVYGHADCRREYTIDGVVGP